MEDNIFYDELNNKLQCMENALLNVSDGTYDINEIFRSVHTIKGTADLLGMLDVVAIAHKSEDILDEIRAGKFIFDTKLIKLFIELKQFIALIIESTLDDSRDEEVIENLNSYFEKELFNYNNEEKIVKFTVLVLDDSLVVRERTRNLLENTGYNVITANNGTEGFEKITKNKIDIIITDVCINEIGCLDMIFKLKKYDEYKSIPIIMLVADNYDIDIKTIGLVTGAKAWINKKYNDNKLLSIVDKILT